MSLRIALSLFLSAGLAFSLTACRTADPEPEGAPSGAMARCIGEPGYEVGPVKAFIDSINSLPGRCADTGTAARKSANDTTPGDSIEYHMYVMDSRCGFISASRGGFRSHADHIRWGIHLSWDRKDAKGRPLPSGEYFINTEFARMGGRKDTSYSRMAFIRICDP